MDGDDPAGGPLVSLPFVLEWRKALGRSPLPSEARLIAHVLATRMNAAGGSCYPSLATIALESGYSKATVAKYLNVLEDEGWLRRTRGGGEREDGTGRGGRGASTWYRAVLPPRVELSAKQTPSCPPETRQTVRTTDTRSAIKEATKDRQRLTAGNGRRRSLRHLPPRHVDTETYEALELLVARLKDADGNTLPLFLDRFGELEADTVLEAIEQFDRRVDADAEPVESHAAYAHSILQGQADRELCL